MPSLNQNGLHPSTRSPPLPSERSALLPVPAHTPAHASGHAHLAHAAPLDASQCRGRSASSVSMESEVEAAAREAEERDEARYDCETDDELEGDDAYSHARNARSGSRFPLLLHSLRSFLPPSLHLRRLLRLSLPSIIGGVLSVLMNAVNLSFVGHLSPTLLGGAALGNAFVLITGYTVVLGLCSSIDTLCSNAYGAGKKELMSLIAQRAAVAYSLLCVPIVLLWTYTESFLLWAGQDESISAIAGEYVSGLLPTIFLILYAEICKRFLQAQAIVTPQIYVTLLANLAHALAAYVLMYRLEHGIRGASRALGVGFAVQLLGWGVYILWRRRKAASTVASQSSADPRSHSHSSESRFRWRSLFRGWGALFRLGLPGMLMLLLEWLSFEVCVLAAGWMGARQLDTMVVFSNLCTLLTMMPASVAIATSTLIGHSVGAGRARQAQRYARAATVLIALLASAECVVLWALRDHLALVFTSDPGVRGLFAHISPCVLLFVLFDCLQSVGAGMLRGVGAQAFGAKTNLFVYYIIGIPLGFALAYGWPWGSWGRRDAAGHEGAAAIGSGLGVAGLAIGMVASVFSATVIFAAKLVRIDWAAEADKATRRLADEHAKNDHKGEWESISDGSDNGEEDVTIMDGGITDAKQRQQHAITVA